MKKTTPKPRYDVLEIAPELAEMAVTTVRLHPTPGDVPDVGASKIGGTFLWPNEEPWPVCEELGPPSWKNVDFHGWPVPKDADDPGIPLVPVVQLRAEDFPEMEFFPGTDLFQLLWCPVDHEEPIFVAKPFVFWRDSQQIVNPLAEMPRPKYAQDHFLPPPCLVLPEPVVEFPSIQSLPEEISDKIWEWDVELPADGRIDEAVTLYEWELSVCPGAKVGGDVFWVQDRDVPVCECGREMSHLLTLAALEFDAGTYERWCPLEHPDIWEREYEDRHAVQGAAFDGLSGRQHIFICRSCEHWPIQSVFQR